MCALAAIKMCVQYNEDVCYFKGITIKMCYNTDNLFQLRPRALMPVYSSTAMAGDVWSHWFTCCITQQPPQVSAFS